MARVVATDWGWNTSTFDLEFFVNAFSGDLTVTPRRIVVAAEAHAVFKGVDFGDPRDNGFPGVGTIHALTITTGSGASLQFTGLDVSMEALVTAVDKEDLAELQALFFSGDDQMFGTADDDNDLYGMGGDDLLVGNNDIDRLLGGAGADTLVGGLAKDTLMGGSGADVCVFTSVEDSSTQAAADRIGDLGAGDVIDLRAIDANEGKAGNQAFKLVAAFDGRAGQATLTYEAADDITWLRLDTDGDMLADMTVRLDGEHTGFTGFIL